MAKPIATLEFIAVLLAIARIDELLGEHLDHEGLAAAIKFAHELLLHDFQVFVLKDAIIGIKRFCGLLSLFPLLDIAMKLAILGNGMTPEFLPTVLTDLEFDPFLFFILGELHLTSKDAPTLPSRQGPF